MRESSVIWPSARGTLKSTRMNTRRSLRSRSEIPSLFIFFHWLRPFLRLRAIALALRVLRLRAIALALRVLRLRAIALALRVGLAFLTAAAYRPYASRAAAHVITSLMRSRSLQLNPHSLSYQENTFTIRSPIAFVSGASTIDE